MESKKSNAYWWEMSLGHKYRDLRVEEITDEKEAAKYMDIMEEDIESEADSEEDEEEGYCGNLAVDTDEDESLVPPLTRSKVSCSAYCLMLS